MSCGCASTKTYRVTPDRCDSPFPVATWDTPERFSGEADVRDFASWTLAAYDTWLRFEFTFTDGFNSAGSQDYLIAEIQVSEYATGDSPTTVARESRNAPSTGSGVATTSVASVLVCAGLYYKILGTPPATEAEIIADGTTLYAESYLTRVEKKKES